MICNLQGRVECRRERWQIFAKRVGNGFLLYVSVAI